jgi:hypothetical protein
MKINVSALLAGLLVPALAAAQPVPPATPAVRIGAELALLPLGKLTTEIGDEKASFDSVLTFGVGGVLQIPLGNVFTIDLAPRVVFNVKSEDDTDSATELDLRARLTAGGHVSPNARLYVALEPGYSFLFLPIDPPAGIEMSKPRGLTFGFAGGALLRVSPGVHLTTEVGYQFGFQSSTIKVPGQSVDIDVTASFLHVAGGILVDL